MAWTAITSAQTDTDSPIDQTLMDLIRTNDQDHETRLNALSAVSSQDIRDDFIHAADSTAVNSVLWDVGESGAGSQTPVLIDEHTLKLFKGANTAHSALSAAGERVHIDLTEEYIAILEFRIKTANDIGSYAIGFQDVAQAVGASAVATDVSDFIGVVRGTGGDWDIIIDKAGGGPTTSAGHGTQASWTKFKISVTCSATGGSQLVEVDVDDVSVGALATTFIPNTVVLRPVVAANEVTTGSQELHVDYVHAYFSGRPLAL